MTAEIWANLEDSKALKESGFPQNDSYFVWERYDNLGENYSNKWHIQARKYHNDDEPLYAAPTLSEILAVLPKAIEYNVHCYFLTMEYSEMAGNKTIWGYVDNDGKYLATGKYPVVYSASLPALWLKLRKEGLV